MLLLATIISILFVTCHCSNSTICVERGYFGDLRGPYKHIGFNDSLNGDVYEFSRPHETLYLYPHILNTNYYWFISPTLHSSTIPSHCYIGNVATLGSNYLFDINDCQYWMYSSNSGWQSDADMKVSMCQFDDICIEDSIYLTYLNTNYRYIYWNYTVNGAVYYNEITNKYIYPYLYPVGNQTNAKYVIGDEVGDAKAYCEIGTGVPWYYVFDFDHCLHYKSRWQSQWTDEPNMSVTNCSTDQPTPYPTFNPTELTASPTANPTINPTEATLDPTQHPTQHPATSVPTFDPTAVPTIEPTVSTITETVHYAQDHSIDNIEIIALIIAISFILISTFFFVYYWWKKKSKQYKEQERNVFTENNNDKYIDSQKHKQTETKINDNDVQIVTSTVPQIKENVVSSESIESMFIPMPITKKPQIIPNYDGIMVQRGGIMVTNEYGQREGVNNEPAVIKEWFDNEVNLDEYNEIYYNKFIKHGFDRFKAIKLLKINELTEIGVDKLGHRKIIMTAITNI